MSTSEIISLRTYCQHTEWTIVVICTYTVKQVLFSWHYEEMLSPSIEDIQLQLAAGRRTVLCIALCPKKVSPLNILQQPPQTCTDLNEILHTRRHLFLSSTSNFIRIPYSVSQMFNSFKLMSQISVTDTTYFLVTSSVVTGVTSVRVDKQTTFYQKMIEF